MLKKGYVQIYTGDGKGKTTAALGLALRASGAGLKTIVIQFMKGQYYSELDAVKNLKGLVKIEQYGSKKFCEPGDKDYAEHYTLGREALKRVHEVLDDDEYSVIILDEIITALIFNLVTVYEIKDIINNKPADRELILTGRRAPQELIDMADLVTEMKEIKHYYQKGVDARKGIEN